jgi:hypothetical protein
VAAKNIILLQLLTSNNHFRREKVHGDPYVPVFFLEKKIAIMLFINNQQKKVRLNFFLFLKLHVALFGPIIQLMSPFTVA